uniref:F-box domain protein n=1 Tax=Marseillevirus LCMAC202 TaxID=2506606 RepID=A0A481YZ24_9VIRU|nr:MAG: F-box domain protein [Marseillevirus LCMAC202]
MLAIKNTSQRAVMPNDLPEPAYIETLPQETILQIFDNLDMADILNACQTNVLWSNICKDEVLWKKLYEKHFPVNTARKKY